MRRTPSSGKETLMSGKINMVFGFFYLAFTAVLGPAYLVPQLYAGRAVMEDAGKAVAEVRSAMDAGAPGGANLAEKDSAALVKVFEALKKQHVNGKSAHSHGNLEALLNIVAGFVLLTLAIPGPFRALITVLFLAGAVYHSGMLYLGMIFGVGWAFKLLIIGEVSLLSGLVLTGLAVIIGVKKPLRPSGP